MKQIKFTGFFVLVSFLIQSAMAQVPQFEQIKNIPFEKNGKTYATPWLGGFNAPVITSGDLDNDGIDDLAILERGEEKVYTFKNGGTPGQVDYTYDPDLAAGFPEVVTNMMALKDFNCDGVPDLFTYTPIGGAGIGAYIGHYENNILHFDLYINRLYDTGGLQIYMDGSKLPTFGDVNGDGDIDILVFEQLGSNIGYYENQQIEQGNCDTLIFKKKTNCWGEFCECSTDGNLVNYSFDTGPNYFDPVTLNNLVKASKITPAPSVVDEGNVISANCNSPAWNTSGYPKDTVSDPNKYVEFNIGSADGDYALWARNVVIHLSNEDTCDPLRFELRSSADGYTTALGGIKKVSSGCKTISFNLQSYAYYYQIDSVNFRLYAMDGGSCATTDVDLIIDYLRVEGQVHHKHSFDIILGFKSPFCFFHYFAGSGHVDSGKDTIPGTRHFGSTLAMLDFNHDGWSDILVGDPGFDNLVFMINGESSNNSDSIVDLDYFFPSYGQSISVPVFPAAYYLDADNDGKKDLLIAPFQINNCFYNTLLDTALNKQNIWFYKNLGINRDSFQFVTKEFLVGEMVDFGDRPHVVFYDYNRDGLKDLVIGQCHGYGADHDLKQGLILYENTGTMKTSAFTWVTDDFIHLNKYDWYGIQPTFGDLNDDGFDDMIVGLNSGELKYFQNAGLAGKPDSFIYLPDTVIPSSSSSLTPQLVDVNGDNILDLVVGEYQGRTFYYRNDGTELAPSFKLEDNFYGKMDARLGGFYGYSVPFFADIDRDTHLEVLVGDYAGKSIYYDDLELTPPGGPFRLVDTNLLQLNFGRYTSIFGADITDDEKLEYVVGTGRGGLAFFGETPVGINKDDKADFGFEVFPNPAGSLIRIRCKSNPSLQILQWEVLDVTGRQVRVPSDISGQGTLTLHCGEVPRGIYFVHVVSTHGEATLPVILQ